MAAYMGDLLVFDPAVLTWQNLTEVATADGSPPPEPRYGHGFVNHGGLLYVHGGMGENGI